MPTIQEQSSEALKLLMDASQVKNDLTEQRQEIKDTLELLRNRDRAQPRPERIGGGSPRRSSGGSTGGLSAAQRIKQQAEFAEQEALVNSQYEAAPKNIQKRLDRFKLDAEEQLAMRESGDLGAALNQSVEDDLFARKERVERGGKQAKDDPAYQQLLIDREVIRENEARFIERNGGTVERNPENGTPLLPWDNAWRDKDGNAHPKFTADYKKELVAKDSILGDLLGKTGGGLLGVGAIGASALGFEEAGQFLGNEAQEFRDERVTDNIADRASQNEMSQIFDDAQKGNTTSGEAALKAITLALTDIDAAQDIGTGLGAAVGGSKGLGLLGKGAGAVTRAAPGGARVVDRVADTTEALLPRGTGASLAGQGQGVDGSLTTEEARIRAGGAAIAGQAGRGIFKPAENVIEDAIATVPGRIFGRAPTSTAGSVAGGTARGVGRTAPAEVFQGSVDAASEEFGQFATRNELSVGEALANPEARQRATIAAQVGGPLEGVVGGVVGGLGGSVQGVRDSATARREQKAADAQTKLDEEAAEAQQVIDDREARVVAKQDQFRAAREAIAADPAKRDIDDADLEPTLTNIFFDGPETEQNLEAYRNFDVQEQEDTLRALYRSDPATDSDNEDAFIESFARNPAPENATIDQFRTALENAAQEANRNQNLAQPRLDREAEARDEALVVEQERIATERETEARGIELDQSQLTDDTPIDDIGKKQRKPATVVSEYVEGRVRQREDGTSVVDTTANLREFRDELTPEQQRARLRALYRNQAEYAQDPEAERNFADTVINSLNQRNANGDPFTRTGFLNALRDGEALSGNAGTTLIDRTSETVRKKEDTARNLDLLRRQLEEDTARIDADVQTRQEELKSGPRKRADSQNLAGFFFGANSRLNFDDIQNDSPNDQETTLRALIRSDNRIDNESEQAILSAVGQITDTDTVESVRERIAQGVQNDRIGNQEITRRQAEITEAEAADEVVQRQNAIKPFDNIAKGRPAEVQPTDPGIFTDGDLTLGRLTPEGAAPSDVDPDEVARLASRTANIENTLLADQRDVTGNEQAANRYRGVPEQTLLAMRRLSPTQRRLAYEQLAERSGFTPDQTQAFADIADTFNLRGTIDNFKAQVNEAVTASGGTLNFPVNRPEPTVEPPVDPDPDGVEFFKALNEDPTDPTEEFNTNAEHNITYAGNGSGRLSDNALALIEDIVERDANGTDTEERAQAGNYQAAFERLSTAGQNPDIAFTRDAALNLLKDIHLIETARELAGK